MMGRNDEKIDADILKGREDILRARRAAATSRQSSDEDPHKSSAQPRTSDDPKRNLPRNIPQEPSPMMKAVVDANRQKRIERGTSDVPVFDVAKKIMTRQRQATAAKRTAPPKIRTTGPAESVHIQTRIAQIDYNRPTYNNLVAEIVARDIDRLCHR